MSYGSAAALQTAIYQHLAADSALDAVVSGAIYDAVPAGSLPDLYVSIGPEDARDMSDVSSGGALHVFTISVIENGAGFARAKAAAAAISDALIDAALTLTRGTLVYLRFDRARARRVQSGELRRIDLTFRALVDDT